MSNQIKGIVLEVNKHSCIIMTPEGKFQQVPKPNQTVKPGAEITCHQSDLSRSWLKSGAIAAILTLFLFGFSLYQTMLPTAVAYVSLDINPSIEIGVDKNSQVISVKGLNEDGKILLKQVSLKHKNVYLAIEELIAASIENNYLEPGRKNLVFAAVTNETDANTSVVEEELVCATISRSAAKTLKAPVEVLVTEAKPEIQKEAQKNGVSTGKYLLYLDENEADEDEAKDKDPAREKFKDKYRTQDKDEDQDKPKNSLKTLNNRSLKDLGIKQWEKKHPSAQKNNPAELNGKNQNPNPNSGKQNPPANQNKNRDPNQKSGNRGQWKNNNKD